MFNIEELKAQHKVSSLYQLTVVGSDDTELNAYLKPVTMKQMDLFASKLNDSEAEALDMLFELLWVAGDDEIKSDVVNYEAAISQLQDILESDEIKYAKSKNGGKYKVQATDNEGNVYNCELRHPTLHELNIQTKAHPVTSFIKMINRLWISGDAQFTSKPSTVLALMTSFTKNTEKREAKIKKV